MTSAVDLAAEALRTAGHAESTVSGHMASTGFAAFDSGAYAIVTAVIGDDTEGHFDSPAHHDMKARMTDGYRQALEDAGWAVQVHPSGEGLTVTSRAKAA